MDDEAAFLAAMRADPAARLTRHVYADWLEERSDPRHELVRVCEAMRAVPVWSDDYWAWKAQRNELWTRFPIEWLEATGYDGSDYDPIFRDGVPDGVRERWRLIREFTERWHGVSVPDVGGRRDLIAREEARLGLTLPQSVRELIAFAHDVYFDWTGSHRDRTVLSNRMNGEVHFLEAERILLLSCYLGPGVDYYGIEIADLDHPDPPVAYFTDDDGNGPVRQPAHSAPTVTRWIFGQLIGRLFGYRSIDGQPLEPHTYIGRLSAGLRIQAYFDDQFFYESDELLAYTSSDPSADGVGAAARVSVMSRRQVPSGSLPDFLFESDPPTRSSGFTRRDWDDGQGRRVLYDWMPQWRSVLRWSEYELVRPTDSC